MNNKQLFAIFAVAIVVVAAVGIGVYAMNNKENHGDRTVTDSRDRTVTVPYEIESILCIKSCSLELVSWFDSVKKVNAIDSNDAITGDKTYTQVYKSTFSGLKTVTISNAEEIISLKPSIVISSTVSVADLDKEQETYGVPVYAINADLEFGSSAWYEQITRLGVLLKEEKRATELTDGVKGIIKDLQKSSVKDVSAYACGMMFYGKGTFLKTSGTGDYLPFDYSGVTNIMPTSPSGNKQPYNTTIENVLAADFDYIFIDGSNLTSVVTEINGYISTTTLGDKQAITDDNVYKVMTYKNWGTQWDNQLINCAYVAKTVNIDGYSWSFEDKANEIIQLFYKGTTATYKTIAAGETSGGCGHVSLS